MIITSREMAMCRAAAPDMTSRILTGKIVLAKPAVYELSGENGIRDEFLLIPKGATYWRWLPEETRFTVEPIHLIQMVENFAKVPRKPFYDLEHDSCWTSNTKAYGWIQAVELREDGLWVTKHNLTKEGLELLTSGAYKYFSAAWEWDHVDEESGQNIGCWLHSVALTNDPQYTRLEGLVTNAAQEVAMDLLKKLAAILGLSESATEAEVLAAVEAQVAEHKAVLDAAQQVEQSMTGSDAPADQSAAASADLKVKKAAKIVALAASVLKQSATALATVRKGLGLSEKATPEEIVLTAKAATDHGDLAAQVREMKLAQAKSDAEQKVKAAMDAGKVTPAMKETALAFAMKDPEGFAAYIEKQPVLGPPTKTVKAKGVDEDGKPVPTDHEKAIAKKTGVPAADIAMQRAQRTGEVAAG